MPQDSSKKMSQDPSPSTPKDAPQKDPHTSPYPPATKRGYEVIIGLEIHIQLATKTKLFSAEPIGRDAAPNTHVGAVSLGLPGTLPVLNKYAVELAIRAGIACNCDVQITSRFARKNYFYPDLPKGYQTSQLDHPICLGGQLSYDLNGERLTYHLTRIHMEEDAGKNLHLDTHSKVDLNRAGVPLIEVVGEPELRSPAQAAAFLRALHEVVVYLGISHGNLQAGQFRCDANVSIRPLGETTLGTRTEIKNINSFRFVEAAITSEIDRQITLVEGGGEVRPCTRSWDEATKQTLTMRSKEAADDYRYFTDPDLPPLVLDPTWIAKIKAQLPELPHLRRARYKALGLSTHEAQVLTKTRQLSDLFDATLSLIPKHPRSLSKLFMGDLLRLDREHKEALPSSLKPPLTCPPPWLAEIVTLAESGTLTKNMVGRTLGLSIQEGRSPKEVMEAHGLGVISNNDVIERAITALLQREQKSLARYHGGQRKLFGFFMGGVMRALQGKGDPALIRRLLQQHLQQNLQRPLDDKSS